MTLLSRNGFVLLWHSRGERHILYKVWNASKENAIKTYGYREGDEGVTCRKVLKTSGSENTCKI